MRGFFAAWFSPRTEGRLAATSMAAVAFVISVLGRYLLIAAGIVLVWAAFMWATRWNRQQSLDVATWESCSRRVTVRAPNTSDRQAIIAIVEQPGNADIQGHSSTLARSTSRKAQWFYALTTVIAVHTSTREVLAEITFSPTRDLDRVTIGFRFNQDELGKGLATEALATAIEIWMRSPQERPPGMRLCIETAQNNLAMQRVIERLGYTAEAETFEFSRADGANISSVRYLIDRPVPPAWAPVQTK